MTPGSTEHALLERNMVDRELSNQIYDPKSFRKINKNLQQIYKTKLDTKDHIHVHEPGDHIQKT